MVFTILRSHSKVRHYSCMQYGTTALSRAGTDEIRAFLQGVLGAYPPLGDAPADSPSPPNAPSDSPSPPNAPANSPSPPNAPADSPVISPGELIMFCMGGNVNRLKVLLASGADKNEKDEASDNDAGTVWNEVVRPSCLSYLIGIVFSPLHPLFDAQNGRTALIWVSYLGYIEEFKALMAAGADVNAKDNVGVIRGAVREYLAVGKQIYYWVESSVPLPHVNQHSLNPCLHPSAGAQTGQTALIRASETCHLEIAQALMAAGANLDAKNNVGTCLSEGGIGSGYGLPWGYQYVEGRARWVT